VLVMENVTEMMAMSQCCSIVRLFHFCLSLFYVLVHYLGNILSNE